MKISSPKVYLQSRRELKQYNLILVFYPVGCIAICWKYMQAVCVCLCSVGVLLCTEAAWSQATGGPSVRAATWTPHSLELQSLLSMFCVCGLGWDSPLVGTPGTWLEGAAAKPSCCCSLCPESRGDCKFIQAIKCSSLRQTQQPVSFSICIKRITVLRSLVRGAT